ncbi:hypothetical protein QE405_001829 [Nocardioides zeae]|uniref:Uncharacterized protein n=1 Tax=Nocardioides zeae TaxID=1457234 RepID=A0AAJ1TYC0_9ACTN|nr:hypothetical protein [Nocardioides zeae]
MIPRRRDRSPPRVEGGAADHHGDAGGGGRLDVAAHEHQRRGQRRAHQRRPRLVVGDRPLQRQRGDVGAEVGHCVTLLLEAGRQHEGRQGVPLALGAHDEQRGRAPRRTPGGAAPGPAGAAPQVLHDLLVDRRRGVLAGHAPLVGRPQGADAPLGVPDQVGQHAGQRRAVREHGVHDRARPRAVVVDDAVPVAVLDGGGEHGGAAGGAGLRPTRTAAARRSRRRPGRGSRVPGTTRRSWPGARRPRCWGRRRARRGRWRSRPHRTCRSVRGPR